MKKLLLLVSLLTSVMAVAVAQAPAAAGDLQSVLSEMNQSAAGFKSAQASFQFDQYTKVVDETDTQRGEMFLRRSHGGTDASLRVDKPAAKQVVFKDCTLWLFEPGINKVTEHNACKDKGNVEAFMSLGFGARGDDLVKSFDIQMTGWETINGVKTAKLELVAKDPKVRNLFSKFVLWIDPARNISLKQQFFEPSGDYRLATYSNFKLNSRIPEDAFRLKTNDTTQTVKQ